MWNMQIARQIEGERNTGRREEREWERGGEREREREGER